MFQFRRIMKNTLKDVASNLQCSRIPFQQIQIQIKYTFTWNTNNEKIIKVLLFLWTMRPQQSSVGIGVRFSSNWLKHFAQRRNESIFLIGYCLICHQQSSNERIFYFSGDDNHKLGGFSTRIAPQNLQTQKKSAFKLKTQDDIS